MQLPIKAHYAALAMLSLAVRYDSGQSLAARAIARQNQIPEQFLGQILQQLRTSGLVVSVRGPTGGFRLARSPDQISLADILLGVHSGAVMEFPSPDLNPLSKLMGSVWQQLSDLQTDFLRAQKLDELVHRMSVDSSHMFYI